MSTNENTPDITVNDDLDAFSADFFGQKPERSETTNSEKEEIEVDAEQDDDATQTDDTHSSEEPDTLDTDDDTTEDDSEDVDAEADDAEADADKPKPKKNRFQERIDELTAKAREAERRAAELEAKLNSNQTKEPNTKAEPAKVEVNTRPTPDDKNPDGTEKYALGEFDPQYVADMVKHEFDEQRRSYEEQQKKTERQTEMDRQRAELQTEWQGKLDTAQERYPDFSEKGEALVGVFGNLDEAYGEYLSSTIMSMEYGPDVVYYLANNTDEAQKIVASGPAKATIALGRLEAKFADASEQKQQARPKISKAPAPPGHINKGSASVKAAVEDDTDDLEAFEAKFFKNKRL